MIKLLTLKYLVKNNLKDAEVLHKNARFPAAVYLAGYAVEIGLKYKICKTLQFNGFPETRQELAVQLRQFSQSNNLALPSALSDVRNHNLPLLLTYSGAEYRVKNNLLSEWAVVNTWNPENRYKKLRLLERQSEMYIGSAKKIIKELM